MKLSVPFHPQEYYWTCGPACLRIVLDFFGVRMTEGELEAACETTVQGTSLEGLAIAATELGFEAQVVSQFTLEEVAQCLQQTRLVTAVILPKIFNPNAANVKHTVVVVGVEGRQVVYHDPDNEHGQPEISIPSERFQEAWNQCGGNGVINRAKVQYRSGGGAGAVP